ncbi:membrane hypothetical protein [Hyella patelloides LEGE 07179]|uniref:Uncharacterized protein n=1 Tax=Hyella patelloides LEGE 07179 TaxID=945734 RepID=A0A563W1E4_9CYAN|nr:hypothetical protein [Hyella patelloides]VEP17455.1 membrane hypothetical protein [Hyella patelloides LEGE 07179]
MNVILIINIIKIWISVTVICSLIIGTILAISSYTFIENKQKVFSLFIKVISKSFLGGLQGSLVGLVLGWIIYLVIPLDYSSPIGSSAGKSLGFLITFIISWTIGMFADGIKAGINLLKKYYR